MIERQIRLFRDRAPHINKVIKTQSVIANAVTQIYEQIEQIQGKVTLDPFDGAVVVRVRDPNGSVLQSTILFLRRLMTPPNR